MSRGTRCCKLLPRVLSNVQVTECYLPPMASYSKAFMYKQLMRDMEKLWEKKTAADTVL